MFAVVSCDTTAFAALGDGSIGGGLGDARGDA